MSRGRVASGEGSVSPPLRSSSTHPTRTCTDPEKGRGRRGPAGMLRVPGQAGKASGPAAFAPVSGGASRPQGWEVGREGLKGEGLKGEGHAEGREGGRSQLTGNLQ